LKLNFIIADNNSYILPSQNENFSDKTADQIHKIENQKTIITPELAIQISVSFAKTEIKLQTKTSSWYENTLSKSIIIMVNYMHTIRLT
jgi:hypothetical protein